MNSILVIEDEESLRKALERFLKHSFDVVVAASGEQGLGLLRERSFDLLLVDLMLPKMSGIDLLRQAREIQPALVAIVMTGYGTIPSAIEAIKAGAFHYVTKPFELEDLFSLVSKGLEHRQLREENRRLRQALQSKFSMKNIIGTSPKMKEVYQLLERVAATDSTILILGESGTGKELLAKAIHYRSNRADYPLVTVNCAAIPETLLESELFGHRKGAFTGAVDTHIGRFEQAHRGTIFLDEIGDMSLRLQVKVLRVLQDRRFEPVGSTKTHEVDVRIVTATHIDLAKAVQEGRFREDLFYRLNVIPMVLPPLRERKEDIPLLAKHFLQRSNSENGRAVSGLHPQVIDRFLQYSWPGNIRELENMIERLVVLKGKGEIVLQDLPPSLFDEKGPQVFFPSMTIPDSGVSLRELMKEFEGVLIEKALAKSGGNKNKAATLLQLNRTTLIEKLKKQTLEGHDD